MVVLADIIIKYLITRIEKGKEANFKKTVYSSIEEL